MIELSNGEVGALVKRMAESIRKSDAYRFKTEEFKVYPVPRGGIPVAYLLKSELPCYITANPEHAHIIVDDLVDSGTTRFRFQDKPFFALIDKREPNTDYEDEWVVFPWEKSDTKSNEEDIIIRLLQQVGEDPKREGLLETPKRVLKAWQHWCSGYKEDPKEIMKCFADGAKGYDEMVFQKDIPFYSHCEHHMAPFFGTAVIAYIPDQKILGLSKLARLLHIFSRRLQVQERLTTQVADTLMECLQPKGVGVVVKARHLCMESRGVAVQGSHTVTSALRGSFLDNVKVRDEFLQIAK